MLRRLLPLPVLALALCAGFPAGAADPKDEAVKTELKALEGTWEAKSALFAGKDIPPPAGGIKLKLVIDKYTVEMEGKGETGTFAVDPGKNPRTLDYTP